MIIASVVPFRGVNSHCMLLIFAIALNFGSNSLSTTFIQCNNKFIVHTPLALGLVFLLYQYTINLSSSHLVWYTCPSRSAIQPLRFQLSSTSLLRLSSSQLLKVLNVYTYAEVCVTVNNLWSRSKTVFMQQINGSSLKRLSKQMTYCLWYSWLYDWWERDIQHSFWINFSNFVNTVNEKSVEWVFMCVVCR